MNHDLLSSWLLAAQTRRDIADGGPCGTCGQCSGGLRKQRAADVL
jgi:hypothetical protein